MTWAVDGWRDDTFTAALLFALWGLLRLRADPRRGTAVAAGILCAIACLTRITALSFVVPGLLWILAERSQVGVRERARAVAIAAATLALAVAPYLFNCAIATGDTKAAMAFLLAPDLRHLTPRVALEALGLGFFSIGVGLATMITYAAYADRTIRLGRVAAATIAVSRHTARIMENEAKPAATKARPST